MVLYMTPEGQEKPDLSKMPAEMVAQMNAAFGAWLQEVGTAVVDPGAPMGNVSEHAKAEIGGYTILQAESLEAAQALLDSHPFYKRGGYFDLYEMVEIPA